LPDCHAATLAAGAVLAGIGEDILYLAFIDPMSRDVGEIGFGIDIEPDLRDLMAAYPRGNPNPRVAMMPRWISLVPAAIVPETLVRYEAARRP
jgi:hypothetical protein